MTDQVNRYFSNFWNSKWALSLTAGVFLGISYPPFPFPFLVFPAFVFLIRLAVLTDSAREATYYVYPSLVIWNIISTYWLIFATVAGGIAAILANSAVMLIPYLMIRRILHANKSGGWIPALSIASVWTAYEFLHHRWDLSWPWLTLGNAWSNVPWAVQYIEFTGSLGISFWIVAGSFWLWKMTDLKGKNPVISTASVIFIPVLISLIMFFRFDDHTDEHVHAVIAQPNYDSYLHLAGYPNATIPLLELIELSGSAITENTQVVLWPENAVMGRIDERMVTSIEQQIREATRYWGIPVVTGATFFKYYLDEDTSLPPVYRLDGSGTPFNYYNSAIGIYPDGTREWYLKNKLVPIVERFPFVNQLRFIPGIDWPGLSGYGRGRELHLFSADDVSFPAVVCYDSVFPDLMRRAVLQNAGFHAVVTNDGWWGDTSGHIQHYDFARLRAIETRRAVVRSANNGISGMILADGSVHSRTEYWTRTAFEVEIPIYTRITFYTRFGDWIGYFSLVIGLVGWGFFRFRKL